MADILDLSGNKAKTAPASPDLPPLPQYEVCFDGETVGVYEGYFTPGETFIAFTDNKGLPSAVLHNDIWEEVTRIDPKTSASA